MEGGGKNNKLNNVHDELSLKAQNGPLSKSSYLTQISGLSQHISNGKTQSLRPRSQICASISEQNKGHIDVQQADLGSFAPCLRSKNIGTDLPRKTTGPC